MIIRSILLFIYVGMVAMGCNAAVGKAPTGEFIRAIGNRIYLMDFEAKSNKLFYEFPVGTIIEDKINQIDFRTILLSLPEEGKIVTIDLKSKVVNYLGKGLNPVYMPEFEKIIYYGKDSDGQGAILISDKNLKSPKFVTRSNRYDPRKIVKVSSSEVVFQKGFKGSSSKELWKFDVVSHGLKKISKVDDCLLVNAWRGITNQLVCQKITVDRFNTYYYFLGLDDGDEQPLSFKGNLNVGVYLDDIDAIIIQKTRVYSFNEHIDLWVYRFSDGSSYKIMNDAGFAVDAFLKLMH